MRIKKTFFFPVLMLMLICATDAGAQFSISRPVPKPQSNQNASPAPKQKLKPKREASKPQGWKNETNYVAPEVPKYPVVDHENARAQRRNTPNNMCCLADDYFYGDGDVSKDLEKAAYWYYQAAMEGHDIAQNNLGLCYEKGYGVEKNLDSAAYWYWQAAQQGNVIAQCNVGNCYRFGWGVEQNLEIAKQWYRLAESNGDYEAARILKLL